MTEPQKLWVAALRSGKYKQARGRLMDKDGGYCCLGVLTKIAGDAIGCDVSSELLYNSLPPENVRFWSCLRDESGWYKNTTLVFNNDQNCFSFSQIADIIEENAQEIFTK